MNEANRFAFYSLGRMLAGVYANWVYMKTQGENREPRAMKTGTNVRLTLEKVASG